MTIEAIKAVSYREMSDYLSGTMSSLAMYCLPFDNIWIVSITDPDIPSLVGPMANNAVALRFHDIEPELSQPGDVLMTPEQADRVVKFLNKAHSNEGTDILLVNCMAGISRSGAVASFARQMFGLDYDMFKRANPRIVPNTWVGKLLRSAWQET